MDSNVVDSRQKMLSVNELLDLAAKNTGIKAPINELKKKFLIELAIPKTYKFRNGNTIFMVHPSEERPHWGIFRALNADTARNYLESSKLFVKDAYDNGYDFLVTQFEDETILNIFKAIGRNPVRENMGYVVHRVKSQNTPSQSNLKMQKDSVIPALAHGYQVTLQLGTPRKEIK